MAEAILNHLAGARFQAFSAGSQPAGEVHPRALSTLKSRGHDTSALRSKSWDEFAGADAAPVDFVFTVCDHAAAESCPVWPGHPMTIHWGIADPAAVKGDDDTCDAAFVEAYDLLHRRLGAFVALPLEDLDASQLRAALQEIAGPA